MILRSRAARLKHKAISILEWVQCFSIYMAVISRKEPHRVVDLLGYQHLIIQVHQEYRGDGWLGYDRHFHQRAVSSRSWSTIDTTLWNLAFSGKGSSRLCSHCFSSSHLSRNCELNPGNNPYEHASTHPPLRSYFPHPRDDAQSALTGTRLEHLDACTLFSDLNAVATTVCATPMQGIRSQSHIILP